VNDSFEFDNRRYTVLEMEERRVGRIKIEPLVKSAGESQPEDAAERRYGS
jgi:CBS domain containing-hemolysin-like protein